MTNTVLYFSSADDFHHAREVLQERGGMVSSVPPSLIVSSLSPASEVLQACRGAEVLTHPLSEQVAREMPEKARMAAMAFVGLPAASSPPKSVEGLAWDAPGMQSPGRPKPGE